MHTQTGVLTAAVDQGFIAYKQGLLVSQNPYPRTTDDWSSWLHGYITCAQMVAEAKYAMPKITVVEPDRKPRKRSTKVDFSWSTLIIIALVILGVGGLEYWALNNGRGVGNSSGGTRHLEQAR